VWVIFSQTEPSAGTGSLSRFVKLAKTFLVMNWFRDIDGFEMGVVVAFVVFVAALVAALVYAAIKVEQAQKEEFYKVHGNPHNLIPDEIYTLYGHKSATPVIIYTGR
jgi:hypothetical protein